MAEAFLNENLPENLFGAPKAGPGMWASCIRVLDPSEGNTMQQINLEQNEAAVRFDSTINNTCSCQTEKRKWKLSTISSFLHNTHNKFHDKAMPQMFQFFINL
jgi:hypothetical protein